MSSSSRVSRKSDSVSPICSSAVTMHLGPLRVKGLVAEERDEGLADLADDHLARGLGDLIPQDLHHVIGLPHCVQ
eukprot:m.5948 g.5948  ORF g.5948 m.5948 type:complete len:75 (+) comp2050_c0_seq1:44-268(+)